MTDRVMSAYKDEDDKLEDEFHKSLELTMKIMNILDEYNYDITVKMVGNKPEVSLEKRLKSA